MHVGRLVAPLALAALMAAPGAAQAAGPEPVGCVKVALAGGNRAIASPFYVKPTGLGRAMLLGPDGRLLVARQGQVRRLGGPASAGPQAEWRLSPLGGGAYSLRATLGGRLLTIGGGGAVVLRPGRAAGARQRLALTAARGCRAFPEAGLDARGRTFSGTNRDGTVLGFVDTHLHITANMRAGGRVIYGEPFDRFGIPAALGGDATEHGADGSLDITGNLLRTGLPFGTHSTRGWPRFDGWPVFDTNTHQQIYYRWLERARLGGLRLVVAQTVEDDELCRVEPRRSHSCSEPAAIALEVRALRRLQAYVDAQSGGRGRGWFRIVEGPRAARRVIEAGKLAVVIGVESSNPFGCSLRPGERRCTRADVDRGLARYRALGVRSLFIAHWFDNAFAGAALEGGGKGKLIGGMNRLETGRWFDTASCPAKGQGEHVEIASQAEATVLAAYFPAVAPLIDAPRPTPPAGRQCNARGLSALGAYLVRRMIATHTLIEVDHMSERARDRVLAIAGAAHYPLVSSHNGTGGSWTPAELRRLHATGGIASATSGQAPDLIAKLRRLRRYGFYGVGLGTDTGGFASLPGPRRHAHPLRYPFRAIHGNVTFTRERTGSRRFDLNADGVAHYGLMPDLLADARRLRGAPAALGSLFRSAEGYLRMWKRSGAPG